MPEMNEDLDIIIPVYNEGANIVRVLESLRDYVRTPFRILIGYDYDEDDTLEALRGMDLRDLDVQLIKNRGRGALGAILTGFEESRAKAVLVLPADDDYNAPILDLLTVTLFGAGDTCIHSWTRRSTGFAASSRGTDAD